MKEIVLKNRMTNEDAIICKQEIKERLLKGEKVELNLNKENISTTILTSIVVELTNVFGSNFFQQNIIVKNIKNKENFNRVWYGTTFL